MPRVSGHIQCGYRQGYLFFVVKNKNGSRGYLDSKYLV